MLQPKSVLTKEQLFQEKVRLDQQTKQYETAMQEFISEKENLEKDKIKFGEMLSQFQKEKKEFLHEMKALNKEIKDKQDFLLHEQLVFEKKKAILENGFQTLSKDKKRFEQELQVNRMVQRRSEEERGIKEYGSVQNFFNGVNNNLTLKKRYKDLIKIFHPDNISGDNTTIQLINEEYSTLQDEFQ